MAIRPNYIEHNVEFLAYPVRTLTHWGRMRSTGQPANRGLAGKWPLKWSWCIKDKSRHNFNKTDSCSYFKNTQHQTF